MYRLKRCSFHVNVYFVFFFLFLRTKISIWSSEWKGVRQSLFRKRTNIFQCRLIVSPWTWHKWCLSDFIQNIQWHQSHGLVSFFLHIQNRLINEILHLLDTRNVLHHLFAFEHSKNKTMRKVCSRTCHEQIIGIDEERKRMIDSCSKYVIFCKDKIRLFSKIGKRIDVEKREDLKISTL